MAIDHRYHLAIEVEASSFDDLADRLRDLATDIDIGQASPRSLFAGGGSRGHYTLTDRVDHSGSRPEVCPSCGFNGRQANEYRKGELWSTCHDPWHSQEATDG